MPSLHYSFISYDNINLVQEQGSTQIAMSSTEMQSYINSTFLIRTVLLQLYVSLKLMFPSISAPLIGETTTQIILKQVKFRCNQMLFFFGGGEGGKREDSEKNHLEQSRERDLLNCTQIDCTQVSISASLLT